MKRDCAALKNTEFDLLVLGGGIYGAWIAWEAVSRGLKVALIEKNDFGSATSSQSNKIIHGGIRYLKHGDVKRVRESVAERRALLGIAPHMVSPMPFIIPTYKRLSQSRMLMQCVLGMNDALGYDRNRGLPKAQHIPNGKLLSVDECKKRIPDIDDTDITGGAQWHDGFVYDTERLLLNILLKAAKCGLVAVNYVAMTDYVCKDNAVCGVKARDSITGEEFKIRSTCTVNALGPWTARVLEKISPKEAKTLAYAAAMNIVVKGFFHGDHSIGVWSSAPFKDEDAFLSQAKRLFFSTPWRGYAIIGTRFTDYNGDADGRIVSEGDVQGFVNEINEAYPAARLTRESVTFVHKGLLPAGKISDKVHDVQLEKHFSIIDHEQSHGVQGLVSVIGVKYTTARDVAEKAVSLIARKVMKDVTKSQTAKTPMWTEGGQEYDMCCKEIIEQHKEYSPQIMMHLIRYYGEDYVGILDIIKENPSLKESITESGSAIKAQLVHAIRHENAVTLLDLILRRTELGTAECPADHILQDCAQVAAIEQKWNDERMHEEIMKAKEYYSLER